jgi:hypothetical protein
MVEQLLDYYRQANKVLPNKIVFYRDGKLFEVFFFSLMNLSDVLGVDDGQFGKVISHEIPLIREAFNRK